MRISTLTARRTIGKAQTGVILALALVGCSSPTAPESDAARVEQIVDAEMQKAANAAAANNTEALLNNPATTVLGNPRGDVTVVEFFDYQCPYCKAAEPRLRSLVATDPGVKLVIKDFPILTPESRIAAKAALASQKQGKQAAFHHALMDHRGRLTEAGILKIAGSVGLDVDRLRTDMDSPEIADQLISNFNLARATKISVVPGFIIDDRVLSGVTSRTETSKIDFAEEVRRQREQR